MADITIPQAGQIRRRAPDIRVEADQTGGAVAQFGQVLTQIGRKVEDDHANAQLDQLRLDMQRDLAGLRQQYDNSSDPTEIDTGWQSGAAEIHDKYSQMAVSRNKKKIDHFFQSVSDRHGLALGQRSIDLRQDRDKGVLLRAEDQAVTDAAVARTPEEREAIYNTYDDQLADMAERNVISAEEAVRRGLANRENGERAYVRGQLLKDPEAYLSSRSEGLYGEIDPEVLQVWDAQARAKIAADAKADSVEADRQARVLNAVIKEELKGITTAAQEGRIYEDEAEFLQDPNVRAHPDFSDAVLAIETRNYMPDFTKLPARDRAAVIASERKKKVSSAYETKRLIALEASSEKIATRWKEDPINAARDFLGAQIADLPDPKDGDPQAMAAGLAARHRDVSALYDAHYVETPEYFTDLERDKLLAAADPSAPPEDRIALAGAIVAAFGEDAPEALKQIKADVVFEHAGGLLAAGGNQDIATRILRGQQAIVGKTVELPKNDEKMTILHGQLADLFEGQPKMANQITRVTDALYASRAVAVDPTSDEALDTYRASLNEALGGSVNSTGEQTGGVQEYNDRLTVLPLGVSVEQVQRALGAQRIAMSGSHAKTDGSGRVVSIEKVEPTGAVNWQSASVSGGQPEYAGGDLSLQKLNDLQFRAVGDGVYELYVSTWRGPRDVTDSVTGDRFLLNLPAFLKAVGQ
ncbi:hypothetical protein [Roseobacter sp. N2S]|uniref:hypothetical protein n=1 Tax=Roseobacter sp. N2S TaxID=2663844 RepID=UPI00285E60F2|nr:hypothetical protein [Roseobacter sp. N2S]MDR6266537.1 hypothetical protein [Roseobacter sp. N2S]